jgi:hypothetical protein
MLYALLIYGEEKHWEGRTEADNQKMHAAFMAYTKDLLDAGVMKGGEALKPTGTATTLRQKAGKVLTIDGPFAETKEQLGGFYLIDVPDLEKALAWASKCPGVQGGSVEVRPILPTR